jgi:hypothetical protein
MSETEAIPASTCNSIGHSPLRLRTFLLLWLAVAALFLCSHFSFYFLEPHYEGGDFAANALQIRQAKAFHELYGNYSRFGFHHPGPAIFYAYALGEAALFDTLHIVPAPYNAHAVTGVLLQSFFFAWVLAILAKRVGGPLLVPLLLLFAGLHFGMVNYNLPDSAFQSIWPPYALLFLFLCFLVAAASVASGEVTDLLPLVLCGGLLVHGHVAQPLFVVPLFALAYFSLCRNHPSGLGPKLFRPLRAAAYVHLFALLILALFLLPLVLDFWRGEQSNFRLILLHFSRHAQEHKTLAQSLTYLTGFLCYLGRPEAYCDVLTLSSLRFLMERWYFLAMWALIALLTVILLKRTPPDARAFIRSLSIFFAITIFLTLVWGKLQNAEMFAFNAHFNFALLFVPFILLAVSVSLAFDPARHLRVFLYAASVLLGFMTAFNWQWNSQLPTAPRGTEAMVQQVRTAATDDRQTSRIKFLSFGQDGWEWAAGVALALERFGFGFATGPDWSFVFGASHRANLVTSLPRREVAFWKIQSPALGWDKWISTSVPPMDPTRGEITFSGPVANASAFAIAGWDSSGGALVMGPAQTALLYFTALPTSSDVQIDVLAASSASGQAQRLFICFNDGPSESFEVSDKSSFSFRVSKNVWNSRAQASLALTLSELPVTPSSDMKTRKGELIRIDFHRVNATMNNGVGNL